MNPVSGPVQELAQAALAEIGHTTSRWRYRCTPQGRATPPSAIVAAPKTLATGNADHAREIYQGRFTLAGTEIDTGPNSPFSLDAVPLDWRVALASFAWLGDLAAADNELVRARARCLIADWIAASPRRRGFDWTIQITADRLIAWLTHAPFFLTNAGEPFHHALLQSIGRQVRHLHRALPGARMDRERLRGAIALNHAVICTKGLECYREHAADLLSRTLRHQILPDGGHMSRNPALTAEVLAELLPLKACFMQRKVEPPLALVNTVDRMFPLLRLFLHGDKGLAFFNGASEARRTAIASLLVQDTERASTLSFARQSGYARLEQGRTVIIADTGTTRSVRDSDTTHAGTLSFEMSHGNQRIVVNCGHCADGPEEWRTASAATAAHSTLTIAGQSSTRVFRHPAVVQLFGGPLSFGPDTVIADLQPSDAGLLLSAWHDGYAKAFGLTHRREIYIARDGTDIRGEDRLVATDTQARGAHPFAIRFHLHPSVKASMSKDSRSILLMLPDKSGWTFNAKGAPMALEESVYFADRQVPHRTAQIVLSAETSGSCCVNWAFRTIEKTAVNETDRPKLTRLPLRGGRMNDDAGPDR